MVAGVEGRLGTVTALSVVVDAVVVVAVAAIVPIPTRRGHYAAFLVNDIDVQRDASARKK